MAVSRDVSKHSAYGFVGSADAPDEDVLPNDDDAGHQGAEPVTGVTVLAPYQVNHLGVVYSSGEHLPEVPRSLAARWVRDGWVSTATA